MVAKRSSKSKRIQKHTSAGPITKAGRQALKIARVAMRRMDVESDICFVQLMVPDSSVSGGVGDVHRRTIIGKAGTAEALAGELDSLADRYEPRWPGDAAAPGGAVTQPPPAAKRAAELLDQDAQAMIAKYRKITGLSHYGGRECVVLTVSTFVGDFKPSELPIDLFSMLVLAPAGGGFDRAVEAVHSLAISLDPLASRAEALRTLTE